MSGARCSKTFRHTVERFALVEIANSKLSGNRRKHEVAIAHMGNGNEPGATRELGTAAAAPARWRCGFSQHRRVRSP